MMEYQVEAFQFASRKTCELGSLGSLRFSPRQRPEIGYDLKLSFESQRFNLGFADIVPRRPSIGAFEYIQRDVDALMVRRWPFCLAFRGTVNVPERDPTNELRKNILEFTRKVLWDLPEGRSRDVLPDDQRASQLGYRRLFIHGQPRDFAGVRLPSPSGLFVTTKTDEPIGPGVASLPGMMDVFARINEMVWSEILAFPHRTTAKEDRRQIKRAISAKRKHYNSNGEYEDARRHASNGEVKAAVRSAASAVDAILRYYREVWGVPPPSPHQPFDEKIEEILAAAGNPSYRSLDPAGSQNLLHLYRCRNSMHDGDCCYKASDSTRIDVNRVEQVVPWLDAVEAFIAWIDSLV